MTSISIKCIESLALLEKENSPDFTDQDVINEYCELLNPLDDDAIRDVYRAIKRELKFPDYAKFRELCGYPSEDKQKLKILNEWERFLVTGKSMSFVSLYYFNEAGGANRFRDMDTTAMNFFSRLTKILEAVYSVNGPKFPSERIKKADDKAYLPKWDGSVTEVNKTPQELPEKKN